MEHHIELVESVKAVSVNLARLGYYRDVGPFGTLKEAVALMLSKSFSIQRFKF